MPHTPSIASAASRDAVSLPAHLRRIVLAGYMGAGKSTVGHALAERTGWQFVDLDDLVTDATGLSVPEIFASQGEAAFRRYESQSLARALGGSRVIIALGGGAPEILTNRLLIEQTPGTCALLLHASFPVLFDRCTLQSLASGAASRPNLADPAAALTRYLQRLPHYRRLAHGTVHTDALSPQETVEAALHVLQNLAPPTC